MVERCLDGRYPARVAHRIRRRIGLLILIAASLACVPACSTSNNDPGELSIVTSIDVYADIARTVSGGRAAVTSFISDPAQDPHSYEATARNQLAAARADVIIENGGGYDDFMDRMRAASRSSATVLNVVRLSGRHANEHVWYDFPTVAALATRLAAVLSEHDPAHRAAFRSNAARFVAQVRALERDEAAVRAGYAGADVAITEPVPVYLLAACGLIDRTPPAFSTAVEDGTDVSAGVLERTLDLFRSHAVAALVYNEQTSGPQTTQVLDAARAADVPRVPVTETLPRGEHYVAWMRANLAHLQAALSGVKP